MTRRILIILALGICSACGSNGNESEQTTPTPTPQSQAQQVAGEEDGFQRRRRFLDEARAEARQVAADYLKQKLPTWAVKGIASTEYQAGIYWVAVDVTKGNRSVVISLAVRKFFPESGEPYWKAVPLHRTLAQQLHDLDDATTWERLNDALLENEELESQIPDDDPGDSEPPDRR